MPPITPCKAENSARGEKPEEDGDATRRFGGFVRCSDALYLHIRGGK